MESGRQRQFHIHDCLGRGGYGEVYRATMLAPGGIRNDVAVKLLRVDLDPGHEAVHRLRDEARLLSLLHHPAILRVFDLALLDGRVGLVTEFVEGEDLATLIGPTHLRGGSALAPLDDPRGMQVGVAELPVRAVVEVTATVAEALDAAWSHPGEDGRPLRLVHRDVKPSNIRIGRHGEVKLLDFGIARSMAETSDREARTGTGSTVGSLPYMAPERFGRAPVGPAADVFGLGCTLFEALAGRRLFVETVPVEMFRLAADRDTFERHVEGAMAALPAGLPPDLVRLVRQMLAYAPEERPSPADVRVACERVMDALPGEPLNRWVRSRAWRAPTVVSGYLEGKVITEGTLSHSPPPTTLTPFDTRSSETFRMDLDTGGLSSSSDRVAPHLGGAPALGAPRRGSRWRVVAAVALGGALIGGGWRLYSAQGEPGPTPVVLPAPVPVRLPAPAPVDPGPVQPVNPDGSPSSQPADPDGSSASALTDPPGSELAPIDPKGGHAPPGTPPIAPQPPGSTAPSPDLLQSRRSSPQATPAPVPDARGPAPAPALVEPAPAPLPDPAPVEYGRVSVVPGTVKIELYADGRSYKIGRVPVGRYELFADFGSGLTSMTRYVDVVPDLDTVVRCNTLRYTCDVDR